MSAEREKDLPLTRPTAHRKKAVVEVREVINSSEIFLSTEIIGCHSRSGIRLVESRTFRPQDIDTLVTVLRIMIFFVKLTCYLFESYQKSVETYIWRDSSVVNPKSLLVTV